MNDRAVNTTSSSNAHYKGYLETLLSYDDSARNGHLRAQVFALDMPGHFNDKTIDDNPDNPGYKERYRVVSGSKIFDTMSPITNDFLRYTFLLCL